MCTVILHAVPPPSRVSVADSWACVDVCISICLVVVRTARADMCRLVRLDRYTKRQQAGCLPHANVAGTQVQVCNLYSSQHLAPWTGIAVQLHNPVRRPFDSHLPARNCSNLTCCCESPSPNSRALAVWPGNFIVIGRNDKLEKTWYLLQVVHNALCFHRFYEIICFNTYLLKKQL